MKRERRFDTRVARELVAELLIVETEETFVPYGVGYVEFEGQARVEGRLTEADPSKLRIGMTMETVLIPFGDGRVTYAFRPVEDGA